MTPTERAELLTSLYALRSQAGALHRTSSVFGLGRVAVDIATAADCISEAINTFEKLSYDTKTTT